MADNHLGDIPPLRILDIFWLPDIVDKLADKHGVDTLEVEEVFSGYPRFRRIERGKVRNEDLYTAMGQTIRTPSDSFLHSQNR